MAAAKLPQAEIVGQLLGALLGDGVTAKNASPLDLRAAASAWIGVYAADDGTLQLLIVSDLSLAANAGAALSMIPAGVAKDSVRSGTLPENIKDNFGEILNILGGSFNAPGRPHVIFQKLYPSGPNLPPPVAAVLAQPGERLDLEIAIAGYGSGKATLLVPA